MLFLILGIIGLTYVSNYNKTRTEDNYKNLKTAKGYAIAGIILSGLALVLNLFTAFEDFEPGNMFYISNIIIISVSVLLSAPTAIISAVLLDRATMAAKFPPMQTAPNLWQAMQTPLGQAVFGQMAGNAGKREVLYCKHCKKRMDFAPGEIGHNCPFCGSGEFFTSME